MSNSGSSSFVRIAMGIIVLIVFSSAAGLGQAIGRSDRAPRRSEGVAARATLEAGLSMCVKLCTPRANWVVVAGHRVTA